MAFVIEDGLVFMITTIETSAQNALVKHLHGSSKKIIGAIDRYEDNMAHISFRLKEFSVAEGAYIDSSFTENITAVADDVITDLEVVAGVARLVVPLETKSVATLNKEVDNAIITSITPPLIV